VVAELGGRLEITRQSAGGTKVVVDLPVEMQLAAVSDPAPVAATTPQAAQA
jgi:hypothetical protein